MSKGPQPKSDPVPHGYKQQFVRTVEFVGLSQNSHVVHAWFSQAVLLIVDLFNFYLSYPANVETPGYESGNKGDRNPRLKKSFKPRHWFAPLVKE